MIEEAVASDAKVASRARELKADLALLMDELVAKMEEARQEGFAVQFGVGQQNGTGPYVVSSLFIIKSW